MIVLNEAGEEMHIGDYFIAATGHKFTYRGDGKFDAEKVEIPFRLDPPTLRNAIDDLDIAMLNKVECCHNCSHFGLSPMSAPAGWCSKYRSKQVNTDEFSICDDYCARPGFKKGATE